MLDTGRYLHVHQYGTSAYGDNSLINQSINQLWIRNCKYHRHTCIYIASYSSLNMIYACEQRGSLILQGAVLFRYIITPRWGGGQKFSGSLMPPPPPDSLIPPGRNQRGQLYAATPGVRWQTKDLIPNFAMIGNCRFGNGQGHHFLNGLARG